MENDYEEPVGDFQKIKTINSKIDLECIDNITIGYVTGKYLELVNIYNHCLNLLK